MTGQKQKRPGGTGLGVAFCFAVAQAHGAVLTFESQPGRGTRAQVRFPTGERLISAPAPAEKGKAPG